MESPVPLDDPLIIAGKSYASRLLTGTGKFKDFDETRRATEAAGAQIVTVALRRMNLGQDAGAPNLLDVLPPDRYTILPNTAGCYTADDAVRTCQLARELLDGHKLVKLEVLGDEKTLFPDVVQTLAAAERLVADGFDVMVYTSDDPILARAAGSDRLRGGDAAGGADRLRPGHPEQVEPARDHRERQGAGAGGCRRRHRLRRRHRHGAGLRRRADEHRHRRRPGSGAHGARDEARRCEAGRDAFLAGRIPRRRNASASSPIDGLFF